MDIKQQEIRDSNDRYLDRKEQEREAVMQSADQVKGAIQIQNYANADFAVDEEYAIDMLLFDTLLVHLVDGDLDGKTQGGIYVPNGISDRKVWRTGKVILAGVGSRHIKEGDYVIFPSDKGIITKSVNIEGHGVLRDCMFIAEDRIFARAAKKG